ncbi:SDR family NAD(P)-dependent oxidoreductase [Rhodococcus pyridinivorans]
MTGGTSGFGAIAAERISGADGIRLVHSARHAASTGEALPLDLSSLDSVRTFVATVRERSDRIDGLVLNAGMIRSDVAARTVDGFETTFVVNHLAHYLLLRQLLPALADRAVVVATTSGTRDPATGAGLVPPRHGDAGLLAHPERDPDLDTHPRRAGQHAYTASKLCIVQDTFNTQTEAGNTLADLVLGDIDVPDGRGYLALRRGEPSVLARSDEQAERSWRESARLVGLPDR